MTAVRRRRVAPATGGCYFCAIRRKRHETAAGIPVETPSQLAERLSSELCELVDLGEISPAFAQRVRDDLFEPATADGGSSLRVRIWSRYVEELAGQVL